MLSTDLVETYVGRVMRQTGNTMYYMEIGDPESDVDIVPRDSNRISELALIQLIL